MVYIQGRERNWRGVGVGPGGGGKKPRELRSHVTLLELRCSTDGKLKRSLEIQETNFPYQVKFK